LGSYCYNNTSNTDNPDYDSNVDEEQEACPVEHQATSITINKQQYKKNKKYKRRSNKVQQRIEWRKNKLSEYLIRGMILPKTSRIMNIPYKTLYEDQYFLRQQARDSSANTTDNDSYY
jgi:hypothetical protein